MKILWFGVFDGRQWRAEYQLAKQFKAMKVGFEQVNMRSATFNNITDWCHKQNEFDLIFVQNGKGFSPELVDYFTRPYVYWATEASVSVSAPFFAHDKKPDFVFANSIQSFKRSISFGIPTIRLHNAYDPELYHYIKRPTLFDVCALGSMTPRRKNWYKRMVGEFGGKLIFYILKRYTAEQACRIYNESRIILHVHAINQNYIPSRLFEGMPTAGCVLVESMGNNYDEVLGRGHFVEFSGFEDMCSKIRKILKDGKLRNDIVNKANSISTKHTWKARSSQMVDVFRKVVNGTR